MPLGPIGRSYEEICPCRENCEGRLGREACFLHCFLFPLFGVGERRAGELCESPFPKGLAPRTQRAVPPPRTTVQRYLAYETPPTPLGPHTALGMVLL